MNKYFGLLLIAIFVLPMQVQAADRAATISQRATLLSSQARGAVLNSNNEQYRLLPGVRASQGKSKEKPQQTLSRVGGGSVIETKGDYVVFTAAPQGAASVMNVNGANTYPTVLNARTGGVGILPGTLTVKLKNMATAAAVAADHGLELLRAIDHLQTAFYRVKAGQDVVAAAAALSADARVASAEAEVIEHVKVPN